MIDLSPQISDEINNVNTKISSQSNASWNFCNSTIMQEIVPGVYLGSYMAAQPHCLPNLLQKGIRYILCVRTEAESGYLRPQLSNPAFIYRTLDIADKETENIMRFFPEVNAFIDEALAKNFKVLIQCSSGNSRSASFVLAYIMQKFRLTFSDALDFVKAKRISVDPNAGFQAQLFEYEPIYQARLRVTIEGSSSKCRPKRKLEQLAGAVAEIGDYVVAPPPSPVSCEGLALNAGAPSQSDLTSHLYKLWLLQR
ncbi:serine/threonine/tyrosine-interacting protein-like isoform X2 [Euwallacea fornicatus]|uniref:serine/threonine/tyrosine-interacting protein-like isoform X2 n=1 Tax=Euwallacea fornicatus TaxID=995702 RepID=UPI00338EC645